MKRFIAARPESRAKADLAAAVDALIAGAERRPTREAQAWIDASLGELNATVRSLPRGTDALLAAEAAAAAAALNNRAERWDDALELARRALGREPSRLDALIARARAEAGLGDYARAYADADAALRRDPGAAAAWTARAAAAYGLGNYLQAAADARRAVRLDPADKTAPALLTLSEGRARDDAPRASLAENVEREYHGIVQHMGQVDAVRSRPPERAFDERVRRALDAAGSRLSAKDYRGAVEEADKALAVEADHPGALYYRAAAENLLGLYGDAARDASRGLAAAPADAALRGARAWALTRMGRFEEAAADAELALAADPRDPHALVLRGHAREGRGDLAGMAADLRAAAESGPRFEADYRDTMRRHGLKVRPPARESRRRGGPGALAAAAAGALALAGGLVAARHRRAALARPSAFESRYEIGRPIGEGGMGVVHEARDRRLGRVVAVKMLRDQYLLDEEAKRELVAEARTVAELQHPAIVKIHAVEEDERGLYLVFERLEGRTLDDVLGERGRLPLAEAKRLLEPVCAALAYAHERDVVHRDLKPANIMLLKEGGVKVLDFGISRHAARAGKAAATTSRAVGTPHYMAPEQEYGFVRRENDVFSLGAVLYEIVAGARPYEGPTAAKLNRSYVRPSLREPSLPLALDALVDDALEPDPERRVASAGEFWDRLKALPETGGLG